MADEERQTAKLAKEVLRASSAAAERAKRLVERLGKAKRAGPLLLWFSFLESTVLPVPLEAVLVPVMLLRREIVWRLATAALAGFLIAAVLGYVVGALAFDTVGLWLIETAGWQNGFAQAKALFDRYGFWALFLIGISPVPAQLAMLLGGAFHYPFPVFLAAMGLSRALRYFGVAALVVWLGPQAQRALEALWSMPVSRRFAWRVGAIAVLALGVVLVVVLTNG
jgi:membrane protein YqaA with SNARE-associated domain